MFVFVVFAALKLAWDARVDQMRGETEQRSQDNERLRKDAREAQKRDEDRARAGGQHRRRQPECPGRVHRRLPDGQQQGLLLGQVAVGDGEPEHPVHGRGAPGDGLRARQSRHPVDHVDGQRPDPVGPVGPAGRGHRIGHQRQPVGTGAAAGEAVQRGVDVHAVGDQFDRHPRVLQQRDHRTRLAVMDRAHSVEQVSAHPGAGLGRQELQRALRRRAVDGVARRALLLRVGEQRRAAHRQLVTTAGHDYATDAVERGALQAAARQHAGRRERLVGRAQRAEGRDHRAGGLRHRRGAAAPVPVRAHACGDGLPPAGTGDRAADAVDRRPEAGCGREVPGESGVGRAAARHG